MKQKIHLFLVDCQIDFCDPNRGTLVVPGAMDDMNRLAKMITTGAAKWEQIHASIDSHRPYHIAHKMFWIDSKGKNPTDFTVITEDDVLNKRWVPVRPADYQRALDYVQALKVGGRYDLMIWPYHCLIGSEGQAFVPAITEALTDYTLKRIRLVDMMPKGSAPYTEHYSVVKAEVSDPNDHTTQLNVQFIQALLDADLVLIGGEASSHCVANSCLDVADAFGNDDHVKKLVFLEDASSPVYGCQALHDDFIKKMTARGMKVARSTDF